MNDVLQYNYYTHSRTHKEHETIALGLVPDINNILVYLSQKDYLNHLNVLSREEWQFETMECTSFLPTSPQF
jgi:hypothetical protein